MKRNQLQKNRGYTVVELLVAIWFGVVIVGVGFTVYTAVHFLAKWW